MDDLFEAARRAADYLEGLAERNVGPSPVAVGGLDVLDRDLNQAGRPVSEVLRELDDVGSPATVGSAGGRYFGFVTGGAHPAGVASAVLARAWDQNSALAAMSPAAAAFDTVALRWITQLLGLPATSEGVFVSGASMANTTALAAARDAVLARAGWSVRDDGLRGSPPLTVVVGGEAHSTVFKALRLLGIGASSLTVVEADEQGAMRADRLPTLSGPTIVLTQAGNVNSGAFDPFGAIIEWAAAVDGWVHVDGAFGIRLFIADGWRDDPVPQGHDASQ